MATLGPGAKLGRGISNFAYGICELPVCISDAIDTRGDSAAFGWGVVRGLNRSFYRAAGGIYDICTFPFPTYQHSFKPIYPSDLLWGSELGYAAFPPELGFETRYDYTRTYPPR